MPNPENLKKRTGFYKGNQLWKLGLEARMEQKRIQELFLEKWGTQGLTAYYELLGKQNEGVKLSVDQRQFMDRIERWAEFSMAKLSRQEITGKDGSSLFQDKIKIEIIKPNEDTPIQADDQTI
jgi:hypothetical protein